MDRPLIERREGLEKLFAGLSDTSRFRLSPYARRLATDERAARFGEPPVFVLQGLLITSQNTL